MKGPQVDGLKPRVNSGAQRSKMRRSQRGEGIKSQSLFWELHMLRGLWIHRRQDRWPLIAKIKMKYV
uniref:Uncharacterized protein n=1 Tax=Steinernema glaseri TaxID=37863 RepID=A0A1I7Z3I4_9BILA